MNNTPVKLEIGQGVQIDEGAIIGFKENGKGTIRLGNGVRIFHKAILRTFGNIIEIGEMSIVNIDCIFFALGGIHIGKNVLLAPRVQIYAQNHGIKKDMVIAQQVQTKFGVSICDDVWVGAGAIILDGVTIGKGAVVGAGSIVTKSIPEYEIWAGNPAKKIGQRE